MSRIPRLLAGAALTAVVLGGSALAQQPAAPAAKPARPTFETTKVDGTDNVYIFRYQNSQSMFVVTGDGVIATDPMGYGRPQTPITYLEEIRKVTSEPVKYVIYSHNHFDHIAGGKPFKDAGAKFVALKKAWERLIPGHPGQPGGRPGTKQDVQDFLVLLQDASSEVRVAAREGKCWDRVEKEVSEIRQLARI